MSGIKRVRQPAKEGDRTLLSATHHSTSSNPNDTRKEGEKTYQLIYGFGFFAAKQRQAQQYNKS